MKDDLFFVIKMLGLTALVVIVFQVKTGGKTIEEQFDTFLKTSILVDYIQEATDGGILLTKLGYQKADAGAHILLSKFKRKKDQPKGLNVASKHSSEEVDEEEGEKKDTLPHRSRLFWSRLRRAEAK